MTNIWPAELAAISAAGPGGYDDEAKTRIQSFDIDGAMRDANIVIQYRVICNFLDTYVYQRFLSRWTYLSADEGAQLSPEYGTADLPTLMVRDKRTHMAAVDVREAVALTPAAVDKLSELSIIEGRDPHGNAAFLLQRFGGDWCDIQLGANDGDFLSTEEVFRIMPEVVLVWQAPHADEVEQPAVAPSIPAPAETSPVAPSTDTLTLAVATAWTGAPFPSKQSLARARRALNMLRELGALKAGL